MGKVVALYGTAAKAVQLVPVLVGLGIVFFSPAAWLSPTLRRWAVVGLLVGSLAGMAALAGARGPAPSGSGENGRVTVLHDDSARRP